MIFIKPGIKSHTTKFIADLLILGIEPNICFRTVVKKQHVCQIFLIIFHQKNLQVRIIFLNLQPKSDNFIKIE